MVDWVATYDITTENCYYVPSIELGDGRSEIKLRLVPAKNGQKKGIRMASDYVSW